MKIVTINNFTELENNKSGIPSTGILPDSVIFRNNDDFYSPLNEFSYNIAFGIVFRISKLGKCIAEKFAHRYFNALGVALNFYSDEYNSFCLNNNLNQAPAYAFDKSLAIPSNLQDVEVFKLASTSITVDYNGNIIEKKLDTLSEMLPKLLSFSSQFFTFKIGDLFYVELAGLGSIKENETCKVALNGIDILKCKIH